MNRRPTRAQPTAASADLPITQKALAAAGTLPSDPDQAGGCVRRPSASAPRPQFRCGALRRRRSAADAEHLDAFRCRLQAGAEALGADLGVAVLALAPVAGEEGQEFVVGGAGT